MDKVFKALADETRRAILDRLYEESGQTLGQLYEAFAESMTRQAVMKHLGILEDANLVATVWRGREKLHYLNPIPIHAIQDRWIKKIRPTSNRCAERVEICSGRQPRKREKKMANRDPDFVYVIYIKTTPEKLWDALTSAEFSKKYWFNLAVTSDWKVGSSVTYQAEKGPVMQGKVLAADRPKLLTYTFQEVGTEASKEPPTKVSLEIEPEAGTETVRLTVTHTDFVANSKHRPSISGGWPAVLSGLKSLLETGKTLQFEQ